jgi:hypothetical protein
MEQKHNVWDVVRISSFLGKPRIGIITKITQMNSAYYVIMSGIPEMGQRMIFDHEIEENITKKQALYQSRKE